MVQQVVAARWMLEAGKHQEALAALNATVAEGIAQVSGTLSPLSPPATRDSAGSSTSKPGAVRRCRRGELMFAPTSRCP
jgi:hypothetical protein